jgi:hypothetical protein
VRIRSLNALAARRTTCGTPPQHGLSDQTSLYCENKPLLSSVSFFRHERTLYLQIKSPNLSVTVFVTSHIKTKTSLVHQSPWTISQDILTAKLCWIVWKSTTVLVTVSACCRGFSTPEMRGRAGTCRRTGYWSTSSHILMQKGIVNSRSLCTPINCRRHYTLTSARDGSR